MFSLKRLFKNYAETGSFSEKLNLDSFVDSDQFRTKTGDVGMILEVRGVDYECLDGNRIDNLTKRLESAFKLFDEDFRVYQYLFKRNNPEIPFKAYGIPVVDTVNRNRASYLQDKADTLFSLSIFYVVLYEGVRPVRSFNGNELRLFRKLAGFLAAIFGYLSTQRQIKCLDHEITKAQAVLRQRIDSFVIQTGDFVPIRILDKHEAFRVLKQILNFSPTKCALAKLKWDTFLDYFLPESQLECDRGFLRLDDYYLKVLTLKEPSAQSFPLVFRNLSEVRTNYFVATEWKADHDADLYRLYHKALDQIGQKDGKCTRVILDSELKRIVYRDLARARITSNSPDFAGIAERHGLKLIRGTIPVPDLRVEYETADRQQARVDLELATEHYRFKNLVKKASAGFSMYARPDEVSKLRRVMDERELIAEIMSL